MTEPDVSSRRPLWLIWWEFKARFHRCPECGTRPDRHYDSIGPRWEDDRIAQVLGIAEYGCPRCGHGSIEERDRCYTPPDPPDDGDYRLREACDGSRYCASSLHWHGCFADVDGSACEDPSDHLFRPGQTAGGES